MKKINTPNFNIELRGFQKNNICEYRGNILINTQQDNFNIQETWSFLEKSPEIKTIIKGKRPIKPTLSEMITLIDSLLNKDGKTL